ncbi:hypothetical protein [Flavilitoribacter nigricans]|uniref:Uncharacterized protein n=1 Tax=Flavilitoribacter nigricans (strain ATCC 23147 / DSM 23189 / NBRC 102662 / NCIMB 1420 / SS-2) TaxID=1122177 RepID=A0A2D0NFP9_FLAN2|nr:hypothetical protein [Flavilitoribacter nigricans]PHN07196.1 hypothetical protein CRP01_08200 [Flavilitoribacter nigricans DSM 23189 = NBRC 102662]
MKWVQRFFIILSVALGILLTLDLRYTRGYFLGRLVPLTQMYASAGTMSSVSYRVERVRPGVLRFQLTNRSFFPKFFWIYRDNDLQFKLTDSTLFEYAGRIVFDSPYKKSVESYGFDCGTGLGLASINPWENFSLEKTERSIYHRFQFDRMLSVRRDSIFYDPIHLEPLMTIKKGAGWVWHPAASLDPQDSVSVRFYLPVHAPFSGKRYDVVSNPVKFSYLDLIDGWREQ